MTRSLRLKGIGVTFSALAVGLWLGAALDRGLAAAETKSVKQQLLDQTGGR